MIFFFFFFEKNKLIGGTESTGILIIKKDSY
jgi:hypothetical protein